MHLGQSLHDQAVLDLHPAPGAGAEAGPSDLSAKRPGSDVIDADLQTESEKEQQTVIRGNVEAFLSKINKSVSSGNITHPTSNSEVFSTAAHRQTSLKINVRVCWGHLISWQLQSRWSRVVSQIEVKFDIDANGILSVTAVDSGTGKKQDITITGASILLSDEQMKFQKRWNYQADSVVYQTEKQLKELGALSKRKLRKNYKG
ncbi:stromal 70 kDa heat shock-related protein, chloroplastic-like [Pistacia vera]|uniref:stromal 70 kDa heat shock-related protein, chloroplastic-like n=1 Tax=Pistacia vera TaxID=55513 RepID=UPI00126381C1|nr:stromal 70 kDa heat shock-related protein, chloroplastic-like [Pistacia vera]